MATLHDQTTPHNDQTTPHNAMSWPYGRGPLLQILLLSAVFLGLYASVLTLLIADWEHDPDYSHGFLVPVLSAYFLYERRHTLLRTALQTNWWGLLVLGGGLIFLFVGSLGAELFLTRVSMVVVLGGLVLFHCGAQWLRLLAFPLGFLFFMIPLPAILLNALTLPLQLFAARLSTFSLQLINLPVYREGNVIFLPHATLEVVEACSGIRSLVSLFALSVVFAYVTQRQHWKQWLLVLSAIPIAIIANAFRIWGTGVLAYLYGMQVADGFYHTFAGWLVFVVAFVLLMLEGLVLSKLGRHS